MDRTILVLVQLSLCFHMCLAFIAFTDDPNCYDLDKDCRYYTEGKLICTKYQIWADINCRQFCGTCKTSKPRVCRDKADCQYYKDVCKEYSKYRRWVDENCPVMCNVPECRSTVAPPTTRLVIPTLPTTRLIIPTLPPTARPIIPTLPKPTTRGGLIPTLPIITPLLPVLSTKNTATCSDKRNDCDQYGGKSLCTNPVQAAWIQANCANYCGVCPPVTKPTVPPTQPPQTTPAQTCSDKRNDCDQYGGKSLCTNPVQAAWIQANCANYCGVCPPVTKPTTPPTQPPQTTQTQTCSDKRNDCDQYGGKSLCTNPAQAAWIQANCANYCRVCPPVTKPTVPPTQPTQQKKCADKLADCFNFGGKAICSDPGFTTWVQENCPLYCGLCSLATTATTTLKPTIPQTPAPTCSDKRNDCDQYGGKSLCTNPVQAAWIQANCANYCGVCPPVTKPTAPPTQPTQQTCSDKRNDCDQYGGKSLCTNPAQAAWIQANCANYCGVCPPVTKPTVPPTQPPQTTQKKCEDKISDCYNFGGKSVCSNTGFTTWVQENCPKYCGLCTQATAKPTAPACRDILPDCASKGPLLCQFDRDHASKCQKYCKRCK